jgi:hypothetical protein
MKIWSCFVIVIAMSCMQCIWNNPYRYFPWLCQTSFILPISNICAKPRSLLRTFSENFQILSFEKTSTKQTHL